MLAIVYIYNRWTKSEIKVGVLVLRSPLSSSTSLDQVRDQEWCSSLHTGHCLHLQTLDQIRDQGGCASLICSPLSSSTTVGPSQRSRLVFQSTCWLLSTSTKSEIKVVVLVFMLAIVYIYQVRDQGCCSSLHAGHCLHLPSQRSISAFRQDPTHTNKIPAGIRYAVRKINFIFVSFCYS